MRFAAFVNSGCGAALAMAAWPVGNDYSATSKNMPPQQSRRARRQSRSPWWHDSPSILTFAFPHLALQVILHTDGIDQAQLSFQPIDVLLRLREDRRCQVARTVVLEAHREFHELVVKLRTVQFELQVVLELFLDVGPNANDVVARDFRHALE